MTTWNELLTDTMESNGESLFDLIGNTMTLQEMQVEFDEGYGETEGIPFTAWSTDYVYFPVQYDGSEWVGCVPRNPDGKASYHQGG